MKALTFAVLLSVLGIIPSMGQVSFSVNFGGAFADEGHDQFSLSNSWVPKSGNTSQPESMRFFAQGVGTSIKVSAMWEVSEIFSAGLVYRMVKWSMDENHRTADMNCLGGQFRVNFNRNTKKIVPFFQGAYYFNNNTTLNQEQATQGSQTQPAFSLSSSTSVGFDMDLGVEFKIGRSWGLQVTAGYGGVQATHSDQTLNLDYGSYWAPRYIDGVFSYAVSAGLKYYTGRSAKQRDF